MASQTVVQNSPRVITRERGVIPGCVPAPKDDHMVVLKPDDIDAFCAQLHAATLASRKVTGSCMNWECGYLPEPKRPVPGRRYCQCGKAKFKAEAVAAELPESLFAPIKRRDFVRASEL